MENSKTTKPELPENVGELIKNEEFVSGTCDDCIHEPEPLSNERCQKCKKFDLWEQGTQTSGDDRRFIPTVGDILTAMVAVQQS